MHDSKLCAELAKALFGWNVERLPGRESPEDGTVSPVTFDFESDRLSTATMYDFVQVVRHEYDGGIGGIHVSGIECPDFCCSWEAAGSVLEAMRERGYECVISSWNDDPRPWQAEFSRERFEGDALHVVEAADAPTGPEAIARAALAALTVREEA